MLDSHVRAQPALLKVSEQEGEYGRLIRRAYLLAVSTVAWLPGEKEKEEAKAKEKEKEKEKDKAKEKEKEEEEELLLLTGQESGDLIIWSIAGKENRYRQHLVPARASQLRTEFFLSKNEIFFKHWHFNRLVHYVYVQTF